MSAAAGLEALPAAAADETALADMTLTAAGAAAAAGAEVHQEMLEDQLRSQLACCEGTQGTGLAADLPWSCETVARPQLG